MNQSDVKRLRNMRAKERFTRKAIANYCYQKDLYEAAMADSKTIAQKFGFSKSSILVKNIATMLANEISTDEIVNSISSIFNILEKYGYDYEEAKTIIESNNSILFHGTLDLMHTLAITNKYGFDEEILTKPSIYSRLTDKKMFALIKELEDNGVDPTLENVTKLYNSITNKRSKSSVSDNLDKLVQLHPLTSKDLFVYSMLYNQNMNKKILSRTK